jgi:predicted SprT family Zn-dependent metalloprotease
MILEAIRAIYEADVTPTDNAVNITVSDVERRYKQWNQKLFGGKLPEIKISVRPLKSASGRTVVNYTRHKDQPKIRANSNTYRLMQMSGVKPNVTINSIEMIISNSMKLTSENLDQVIIHEMIHVEFASNGDYLEGHGREFERRRQELSKIVGFEIPLTHDVSELKLNDASLAKEVLILVAERPNGKASILMITPTTEAKAKEWIDTANHRVAGFKLYKMKTTLAQKYPVRRTLPRAFGNRITFHIPQSDELKHIKEHGKIIYEKPYTPLAQQPGGLQKIL